MRTMSYLNRTITIDRGPGRVYGVDMHTRKYQVPVRTLHVEERVATSSGAFTVEDASGTEWCRHRKHGAAARCCARPCSQRYALEVRMSRMNEGEAP